MKKTSFKNLKIIASIALSLVMVLGFATTVFAADEDIPKTGVKYTLTYPDGEVVTENSSGEALSYDDVMKALDEANWKLIGSGYKSDANGKINLPSEWTNGTIKIVETEVPAGYRMGDVSEQTLELSAGSAEFVNPKIPEEDTPDVASYAITYNLNGGEYKGSTEDIVEVHAEGEVISIHEAPTREGYKFDYWKGSEYQPGDKYTVKGDHKFTAQWIAESTPATPEDPSEPKAPEEPAAPEKITTTAKKGSPETGDSNKAAAWAVVLLASVLSLTIIKRRREESCNADGSTNAVRLNGILLAVIALATVMVLANVVYAADGFVINKIDDKGDPVEGAVFDVYGKPAVTYEEIQEETIDIVLTKTWDDENNKDGTRPTEDKFASLVTLKADGSEVTDVQPKVEPVIEEIDMPASAYKLTWKGLAKSKDGKDIVYTVEEKTIEGYENGKVTGNATKGFKVTNKHTPQTASVDINLLMKYWIYQDGDWMKIVKQAQKVTVSGNGMTEETLEFTQKDAGPKTVSVPGAGTYTLTMTPIGKSDLFSEGETDFKNIVNNDGPFAIDTVSCEVTVDDEGNCSIKSETPSTYIFGINPLSEEFVYNNVPGLEANITYDTQERLNKLPGFSDEVGAEASEKTVKLNVVISNFWGDEQGVQEL